MLPVNSKSKIPLALKSRVESKQKRGVFRPYQRFLIKRQDPAAKAANAIRANATYGANS